MVAYITRAQIGLRSPTNSTALVPSQVLNVAFHHPGMTSRIDARGDIGFRRVCSALRGWQNYHMVSRGWSDIAYQIAIDQEGRVYTLRGINIRSGANGDGTVNKLYGAVLLVLGPGEQPSAKMQASAKSVQADFRKRYINVPRRPTTHAKVRPAGTECPGEEAIDAINAGKFDAVTTTKPPLEDALSAAEVSQIKSHITTEANRVIAANEASNLVWAAYINRYNLQTSDERAEAQEAFDAVIDGGGTVQAASLAMWQKLSPLDASLAQAQADAR